MTDALRLEVKKDQWRQNQGGSYKLTFTVNPVDLDDNSQALLMDFIKAPMGAVYMLGMARVGDDGQPAKAAPAPTEKPKQRFHDKPLSAQAGIRCDDPRFLVFLEETFGDTYNGAVDFVRAHCGVGSRKELDTNNVAADDWKGLNAEYEQWAGLATEQH